MVCVLRDVLYCVIIYYIVVTLMFWLFLSVPNEVENLAVPTRTTFLLTIEWAAPADGGWEGYTVKLEGNGAPSPQTPNKNATTATFTGLTAGTEYTVGVVTMSGGQQSTKVEDTFYTGKCMTRLCKICFLEDCGKYESRRQILH